MHHFFFFADDNTRVILETLNGDEDSDYINASYVRVRYTIKSFKVIGSIS
jgi:protein tyrosine phosphatase